MDEEVKLEDDVEHMAGSSVGAANQDLLSTLERSSQSQQSVSGAYDAEEESPDVALRGTSYTPVQRLCQIRKRLRRSKEDMFREVLQSSDAEKHRAWRETLKENFKIGRRERRARSKFY